MFINNSKRI